MNPTDPRLQDYLDGRMTAEERSAFERRLEVEPELAERLSECLELRAALREEEALPPGFYTRTRAEFVKQHGTTKGAGLRIPSWEVLGLALATGLALALFVPGLLRDELPTGKPADDVALSSESEFADRGAPPAARESEAVVAGGRDTAEGSKVSGEGVPEALEERQTHDRPAVVADPPAQPKSDLRLEVAPTETSPDDDTDAPTPDSARRKQEFSPSPPTAGAQAQAPPVEPSAASDKPPDERSVDELGDASTLTQSSRFEADLAEQEESRPVKATPLQTDSVPAYSVRSLSGEQARGVLSGPEKKTGDLSKDAEDGKRARADRASAAKEQAYAPAERVVLIGTRGAPFSCEGMRVQSSPDEHVIYLSSVGPSRPVAEAGCAVYLPADDRQVVVVDPIPDPPVNR